LGSEGHRAYENGRLVRVKYIDHAIFLNVPSRGVEPTVRESVGWLVEDGECYLKIVWDRRSSSKPISKAKERDSGIVLMKSLVLKVEEVKG